MSAALTSGLLWRACLLLCAGATLRADVTNVRVSGTTATQAVISYTAPSPAACFVTVGEQADLSSPVPDVDPSLFAGANADSRAGNIVSGRSRVFVVGHRIADVAANGRRYSRALQANTTHYFRITCGGDVQTGSFQTANIPLGKTYTDVMPSDAGVPGSYAWPTLDPKDRTQRIVDPLTGVLLRRVSLPGDNPNNWQNGREFNVYRTADGAWTNPGYSLTSDPDAATVSGSQSPLFLTKTDLTFFGWDSFESLTLHLQANCTSAGCDNSAPADRTVQTCLTLDAVHCWTPVQEQVLTSTLTNYDSTHLFSNPDRGISAAQLRTKQGRVAVAADGVTVTWNSGDVFPREWGPGSHITIGGVNCAISSSPDARTILLASGCLSGAQSDTDYTAQNFGVLISKKTTSSDRIGISYGNFDIGESKQITWPNTGTRDLCSNVLGADGSTHCFLATGSGDGHALFAIYPKTGEARFLGMVLAPNQQMCVPQDAAMWDGQDANVFYCQWGPNVWKGQYTGGNSAAPQGTPATIRWTTLTTTLWADGQAFDSGFSGNNNCVAVGIQGQYIVLECRRDTQDTLGWNLIYDVKKPGVSAAMPSYRTYPARMCGMHTTLSNGNTPWLNLQTALRFDWANTQPGGGPWVTKITSGDLGNTNLQACPANQFGVTGNQCTSVTVAGPYCDPSPEAGFSPCSTNPSWGALDGVGLPVEGDHACLTLQGDTNGCSPGNTAREEIRVVKVSGNTIWLQRGYNGTIVANNTGTRFLVAICPDQEYWWNFVDDPHGTNSTGNTIRTDPHYNDGHPIYRAGVQVGLTGTMGCPQITDKTGQTKAACWFVRKAAIPAALDLPNSAILSVSTSPQFAGVSGKDEPNAIIDHNSYHQVNAPGREKQWFLDMKSIIASIGPDAPAQRVNGSLYKLTSSETWNAAQVLLNRRQTPTLAVCGNRLLQDVSGPAQGNTISGAAADSYNYCVANAPGECQSGSSTGDVYINCPNIVYPSCQNATSMDDLCVANLGMYTGGMAQVGISQNDYQGTQGRMLTHAISKYKWTNPFWSARALPDASWILFPTFVPETGRQEVLMAKAPPYPGADSVNRADFVPVNVPLQPPAGVDNALIEFGYGEDGGYARTGDGTQLFCTSRRETCVKGNQPGNGYSFRSENPVGAPCTGSCSVAIPALPQHVVYYRVRYRTGATDRSTSGMYIAVVP